MTQTITLSQVLQLAPNTRSSYRDAFAIAQPVFDKFGISANPLRMAHFMAQILHESGGLTIQFENLNYSAKRLPEVWPTRFKPKGPLDPTQFANNPQKLANEVYGNRMGNIEANDGYNYRGRGLLQLTGRDSYRKMRTTLLMHYADTPNFEQYSDLVIATEWAVKVAAAEWLQKGCNGLADKDSVISVTKAINGGLIGLKERKDWLKRTKAIWS